MAKKGYRPMKTTVKPIPPNTGSNIHMKKDGYTWEDLDRSYWEGFDNAKNKMEKRIEELEKESEELKHNKKTVAHLADCLKEKMKERLTKATEIIKTLIALHYNPIVNKDDLKKQDKILEQAEQFLRETDIDNAIQKANEGLDLDKIADEVEQDLNDSCPDILCEDCTKEDCTVRKLGLVSTKEIKEK